MPYAVACYLERYTPEWNIAKKGGQDLLLVYRLLEENKQEHCKKEKTLHVNTQFPLFENAAILLEQAVSEDYITVNPNKIKNEDKPKRNRTERDIHYV